MKSLAMCFKTLAGLTPNVMEKTVSVGAPIRPFMPVKVLIVSVLDLKSGKEPGTEDSGAFESQGTGEIQVCTLFGKIAVL